MPERDQDTIRTHVDAAVDRASVALRTEVQSVAKSIDALGREQAISLRALRDRVEGGTKTSGDRFEAHRIDDERRFHELGKSIEKRDDEAKETARDAKIEIKELAAKVDGVADVVRALALREAAMMGKVAGAAFVASGIVAVVGWAVDHLAILTGH
jgi:hypothetical protein